MAMFLARRWRKRPKGAVEIDWTHPIADALQWCVYPRSGVAVPDGVTSRDLRDAVRGNGILSSFGTVTSGADPFGEYALIGQNHEVYSGQSYLAAGWGQPGSMAEVLAVGLIDASSIPSSGFSTFSGWGDNSGFAPAAVESSGSILIGLKRGGTYTAFSDSVPLQTPISLGMSVVAGASAGASEVSVYLDGRLGGQVADAGFDSSTVLRLGMYASSVARRIYAAFHWRRLLSTGERRAIRENPWQLIRPRVLRIYSLPPAAPVLSLASVQDITSTSARPKVTLTFGA